MKKTYIKPSSDVIVISTPTILLPGSNTGLGSDPFGGASSGTITGSGNDPIDNGSGFFGE